MVEAHMLQIRFLNGSLGGQTLSARSMVRVGRGSPDLDVDLDEQAISRKHAEFVLQDGVWKLQDLLSTNGTVLDGCTVGKRPRQLKNQGLILMGGRRGVRCQYRLVEVTMELELSDEPLSSDSVTVILGPRAAQPSRTPQSVETQPLALSHTMLRAAMGAAFSLDRSLSFIKEELRQGRCTAAVAHAAGQIHREAGQLQSQLGRLCDGSRATTSL